MGADEGMHPSALRLIDHCVLPVADLGVARQRLTVLGFTVAPEGVHPFGTRNACVYFADDTFLEPLAIGDAGAVSQAVAQGNVFVSRDGAYRREHGEEGFSALVFKTDDADADHEAFSREGLSAGPMLTFSRPFVDSAGASGMASFKLAFTAEPDEPATYFFTCQRIGSPKVDRSALERHANGASGIRAILAEAPDVDAARGFLARTCPTAPEIVEIGQGAPGTGLRLSGIVLAVADRARTEELFSAAGIDYRRAGNRLIVPPAPGQGTIFAFEEA